MPNNAETLPRSAMPAQGQDSQPVVFSLYTKKKRPSDLLLKIAIYGAAVITVVILAGILIYILANGLPAISWDFLTSTFSQSSETERGILPMLINTLYIVLITLLIATPIGICSAIYLTQYAKQGRLVKPFVLPQRCFPVFLLLFSACLVIRCFAFCSA